MQCGKRRQNHPNCGWVDFNSAVTAGHHRLVGLFGHHSLARWRGGQLSSLYLIGHLNLEAMNRYMIKPSLPLGFLYGLRTMC